MLRDLANALLFPGYGGEIRFASLSLDGLGCQRYGNCSLVLRDDLIKHRCSFFERNSTVFLENRQVKIGDGLPPAGYRAAWSERGSLCVAKLAHRLTSKTKPSEFAGLLLQQGKTAATDDFVEAHIWGPITVPAVQKVIFSPRSKIGSKANLSILKVVSNKLSEMCIEVEVRS